MKAIVTVIDDNGKIFCKDRMIVPVEERIVNSDFSLPIKEVRFDFIIREVMDSLFQRMETEE